MNTSRTAGTDAAPTFGIAMLVAVYAAVSALWILLSNRLATWLFPDPDWLARVQTFEEELDTVDGRVVFQTTKGPLLRPEGVVGMFGISRNVTEMVQARRALADRELRYRTLFESHPQPVWVFDLATHRFLDVNAAAGSWCSVM